MTFRRRLAYVSAAAVAISIVLASGGIYVLVRSELRGQVDDALREFVGDVRFQVASSAAQGEIELPAQTLVGPFSYAEVVRSDGAVYRPATRGEVALPINAATLQVASGKRRPYFHDIVLNGRHLRVYTARFGSNLAIQAARSAQETDAALRRVGFVLFAIGFLGVLAALALGRLIARAALRPVAVVAGTAEEITRTRDLSRRIDAAPGDDELARLSQSFNAMLSALEDSQRAQRQLVADASHELRTPLTSMRTNVELLARAGGMDPADREQLLTGVVAQIEELTVLVGDLVDLARDEEPERATEEIALDDLVAEAVERARRRSPDREFALTAAPCIVRGVPERLHRAVSNLLDNATKWSPADSPVEVTVTAGGEVTVRDHGPGFDPDDLPHVFDRFYRARSARSLPGSGLGLAIVRQVAETHGGLAHAENAPGGGALMRIVLPVVATTTPSEPVTA